MVYSLFFAAFIEHTFDKNFFYFFQKTLDIPLGMVYNKYRKLRKEVNKNERKN